MVRVAEGVPTLKEAIDQSVRVVMRVEAASNRTSNITRACLRLGVYSHRSVCKGDV